MFVAFLFPVRFVDAQFMPPSAYNRRESDRQLPDILVRLTAIEDMGRNRDKELAEFRQLFEKRFDHQDNELNCIQEGINGTAREIGLAGEIRNLKQWRSEVEREQTLLLQLKELVDWQRNITRVLLFVGTPLFGVVLIGVLTLLWGMLTNRIEIVVH